MSRSRHHGCGKACGICRPHKSMGNSKAATKVAVRARMGLPDDDADPFSKEEEELAEFEALERQFRDSVARGEPVEYCGDPACPCSRFVTAKPV